jgi:hypothetical protein
MDGWMDGWCVDGKHSFSLYACPMVNHSGQLCTNHSHGTAYLNTHQVHYIFTYLPTYLPTRKEFTVVTNVVLVSVNSRIYGM